MGALGKLLNLVRVLLIGPWTFISALAVLATFPLSQRLGHHFHRLWARGFCRIFGIHVTFKGLENLPPSGAVVIAPNHESMFDIIVMAALPFDFKWISKKEVGRIPFVGWAMSVMGAYFVSRDRSGKDLNVMKEVEDGLRRGRSVVIFPEGTRTRTGELLPFKKGAFKTAQNAGVPMLPVAITGTRAIAPPGGVPSKRGHEVTVRVGEPLPAPPSGEISEFSDLFRKRLIELLTADRGTTYPSGGIMTPGQTMV